MSKPSVINGTQGDGAQDPSFKPSVVNGTQGDAIQSLLWTTGQGSNTRSAREVSMPPTRATDATDPRFFALIIGINKYKNISQLNGCVADAKDMFKYLTETLRVPESNITMLLDGDATRQGIKDGITSLISDTRIQEGDPIVIFYAGHGTEVKAPAGWPSTDDKIQMLCPVDFDGEPNTDEKSQGLPDTTLSALLHQLASAKGDNITVILDSCHSGSGTREGIVQARTIAVADNYQMLASIDTDVAKARSSVAGIQEPGLNSHVLLAACSSRKTAGELNRRGLFTTVLLATLRDPSIQGPSVTYRELIDLLPDLTNGQTPQCEGNNMDRTVFDGKAPPRSKIVYQVTAVEDSVVSWTLSGGEAQGITNGAEVTVYPSKNLADPAGRLRVVSTQACASTLTKFPGGTSFKVPAPAWAVVTKAGEGRKIPVAVPSDGSFNNLVSTVVEQMDSKNPDKANILPVDQSASHEIALSADNGNVIFTIADPISVHAGLSRLPNTIPLADTDTLYNVLAESANFFRHLRYTNNHKSNNLSLDLQAYHVRLGSLAGDKVWQRENSTDLLNRGGDTLTIDPLHDYGFNLVNNSKRDLYVWAFLFDMSNFEITIWSQPPAGKQGAAPDPSVRAGGSLSIGYGSGGANPVTQLLKQNGGTAVTYLKIFASTQPVNLADIRQDAAFKGVRAPKWLESLGKSAVDIMKEQGTKIATELALQALQVLIRDPARVPETRDAVTRWDTLSVALIQPAKETNPAQKTFDSTRSIGYAPPAPPKPLGPLVKGTSRESTPSSGGSDDGIRWESFESKKGRAARSFTPIPTERGISQASVNWPVGDATWINVNVPDKKIASYRLYRIDGMFCYQLDFKNTGGWGFDFIDESGDRYSVSTVINGEHSLQFNSNNPTIKYVV